MVETLEAPATTNEPAFKITQISGNEKSSETAVNSSIVKDEVVNEPVVDNVVAPVGKEIEVSTEKNIEEKPEAKKETSKNSKSKEKDNVLELEEPTTVDTTKNETENKTAADKTEADKNTADATDWKKKYDDAVLERETAITKLKSYEGDVKHEAVKHLQEYLDKGGDVASYYKAQTIDVDKMPEDDLIEDFYKRKNPAFDDMMVDIGLEDDYGKGINLETAIAEAKEAGDRAELSKLMKIKANRIAAIDEQKAFLREQKNTLLESKPAAEKTLSDEDVVKMADAYQNGLKERVAAVKEITVGDYLVPVKPGELRTDSIVMKHDDTGLLYVHGVDENTLLQALHFYENRDRIYGALEKKLAVKSEIKSDKVYNNAQSTTIKPAVQGQSSIKITQVS